MHHSTRELQSSYIGRRLRGFFPSVASHRIALLMETASRASSESLHQSDTALLSESENSPRFSTDETAKRRISWTTLVPWGLCLVLLAGITVQSTILARTSRYSQVYWAATEFEIAQREAPMTTEKTQFTGGIFYNESKQLNRIITPHIPDYAGFPSAEIDAAWHQLLTPMDLYLTAEEVLENIRNGGSFNDLPDDASPHVDRLTGLYQAVPSVFHNLHCVNKLRQAIYLDYYQQERTDSFWIHIQHCIDGIRQALMCAADLTPIPEAHTDFRVRGQLTPIFQVHHMCRDYSDIQAWARQRDVADPGIWRNNVEKNNPGYFDNH